MALAPTDPAVHLARARALESMSLVRYGEARAAAEQAAALDPDNPAALLLLATIEHRSLGSLGRESDERLRDLIGRVLAVEPDNAEALYLKAQTNYGGSPAERAADYRAAVALDPHHHEAIARVDSALVAPLRSGWWTLGLLALLQALLLRLGVDWGAVLKVLVMVLVVLVPWLRFLAARRRSPAGFGRDDGIDPLLVLFAGLTYVGVLAFRLSTSELFGGAALVGCFVLLVLAGLVYRWRARRRRRRYGG